MSAAPHTQGPWEVLPDEEGRGYFRIRGTQLGRLFKIANVLFGSVFDREEAQANACLIAAAPELLVALKHAVFWHDQLSGQDIEMMRAAVAKAEGDAS